MTTNQQITFKKEKAKELADKLAENIMNTGFNVLSKNDFYDYVLFLLDKYSEQNFLLNNSNYENAHILKTKPEKIKATKLNIYLKFLEKDDQKNVLRQFIQQIINGKIKMEKDEKDGLKYQLVIEDTAVYFCLAGKIKEIHGIAHDTSFNKEIFKINPNDFFTVLRAIIKDVEELPEDNTTLLKKLNSMEKSKEIKSVAMLLLDGTLETIGNITPLPVNTIKKGIESLFDVLKSLKK